MFSISIEEATFFAHHGFYKEEQLTGNTFLVSIKVDYREAHYQANQLGSSVNYAELFEITKKRMYGKNYILLEDLVKDIMDDIFQRFSFIVSCKVSLKKLNPAMGGEVKASMVELERK